MQALTTLPIKPLFSDGTRRGCRKERLMRVTQQDRLAESKGRIPKVPQAFSLIELLVVLAIMLIVLFMSRDGYMRDRARKRQRRCARIPPR